MTNLESVPDLIQQLCELYLRDISAGGIKDNLKLIQIKFLQKRRLKRKAFETIFQHLNNNEKRSQTSKPAHKLSILDELNAFCYQLRCQRRYDDALMLEQLIDALCSHKGELDTPVKCMLEFLFFLKDSAGPVHPQAIGYGKEYQHDAFTGQATTASELLAEVRVYGDTKLDVPVNGSYMHYPQSLFELRGFGAYHLGLGRYPLLDNQVFLMQPGCDQTGLKTGERNSYEYKNSTRLFGALVKSRGETLDLRLDIPELPSSANQMSLDLQIPRLMELSEDEGFIDTLSCSGCSSLQSPKSNFKSTSLDIWEDALNHTCSRYHTWERIGLVEKLERPYLTEAGPEAFNQILSYHQRQLQMVDPSLHIPSVQLIATKHLVKDFHNLLIGLPSDSFPLTHNKFSVREGLCLSGTSPMALKALCHGAVQCGTDFCWLSKFAEARRPSSTERFSLVLESFRSAVRKYLEHYVVYVMSVSLSETVLEIVNAVRKAMSQIRFLAQLCMSCGGTEDDNFPLGCHLLSYLYKECLAMDGSEHHYMLLSLFQTASVPYLIFIQDWIFHGHCRDHYGDFMLQANGDYLQFRDGQYWNKGYTLIDKDISETVPCFLADIASDIFLCGKSINLLKLCNPMHFLLTEEQNTLPQLCLTFSEPQVLLLERNAQVYLGRMQAIARQCSRTRQDLKNQRDKAKQELLARAHRVAMEELQRLQGQILDKRKEDDRKKRLLFAELKEQLEEKVKRQNTEKAKEKAEDKTRLEASSKHELLEAAFNLELEQRAREELAQYYAKLSEEAVLREQRALWRVRRHRLDKKRFDFLQAEEEQVREEMKKSFLMTSEMAEPGLLSSNLSSDQSMIDLDVNLPQWAQSSNTTRHLDELAEDQHKVSENPSGFTADVSDLPFWAQKLMVDGTDKAVSHHTQSHASVDGTDKAVSLHTQSHASFGVAGEIGCKITDDLQLRSVTESICERGGEDVHLAEPKDSAGTDGCEFSATVKEPTGSLPRNGQWRTAKSDAIKANVHNEVTFAGDKLPLPELKNTKQAQEIDTQPHTHIKMNSVMSASKETEELPEELHRKPVDGNFVTLESELDDRHRRHHLKMNPTMNATKTSEETIPKVRRQNVFGHISQISQMEFDVPASRLKRNSSMHATKESNWDEFASYQIRPNRRKAIEGQSINKETGNEDSLVPRSNIRMSKTVNALTESEFVDFDRARTERFRRRNVHGHSSDSSVQMLLYGRRNSEEKIPEDLCEESEFATTDQQFWVDSGAEADHYSIEHRNLGEFTVTDLMPWNLLKASSTLSSDNLKSSEERNWFLLLPFLIRRSLLAPLAAQISLVNQSIINYFMAELEIENHFLTLQKFLLLQDGEFSQSLCNQLFDKLASSHVPSDFLNPMFLNSALSKAIAASLSANSKFSHGVSFAIKQIPPAIQRNDLDALECLELTYKVDWPLNIVITSRCLQKYAEIFTFMLKLRRGVWVLNNIFHRLKRDARVHSAGNSAEMRKLQLYRHEMQHFAKVIEEYVASQVILVSWHEFQQDLGSRINNFDDLIQCHETYLNRCIARCLLNKNTASVMQLMQGCFKMILKFNSQLIAQSWQKQTGSNQILHPAFSNLQESYQNFHSQSMFLFKVVQNIAERHYQPHFQDLLIRLGFNNFYKLQKFA